MTLKLHIVQPDNITECKNYETIAWYKEVTKKSYLLFHILQNQTV